MIDGYGVKRGILYTVMYHMLNAWLMFTEWALTPVINWFKMEKEAAIVFYVVVSVVIPFFLILALLLSLILNLFGF